MSDTSSDTPIPEEYDLEGNGADDSINEPRRDQEDADRDGDEDEDALDAAFLENLTGKKPGDDKAEGDDKDAEKAPEPTLAGDDAVVDIKVGDETHRVPVKDLSRLFGQEAALTQRSQQVAEARTTALAEAAKATAVVNKAIERAKERLAPYEKMDFWALNRSMDPEAFAELRAMAKEAHDEVAFLEQEAAGTKATTEALTTAAQREAAEAAVTALTDQASPNYIEGWGDEVYGKLMTFAEAKGLKSARTLVDPAAIKLIHMAMAYENGRTLAVSKVKKTAEQPRRNMRSGSADSAPGNRGDRAESSLRRLRSTHSDDDAEAAFMARLRRDD